MNTNILNGQPFADKNLVKTINRLEKETPSIDTIAYASYSNPTTTDKVLYLSEGQLAAEKLYVTVDALVNLTSNISGDQDFTFNLYAGEMIAATSVVTVPNALNTLFAVRVKGEVFYSRTNGTDLEYTGSLICTPLVTDATANISSITVVNTVQAPYTYADAGAPVMETQLTCTAEVGTATTVITVLGGRATFDNKN